MNNVYTQYFQKSRVFLYPLLRLKDVKFAPTETFICWEEIYSEQDYKILCVYHHQRNAQFKQFEEFLNQHKMFEKLISIDVKKQLGVFTLKRYKYDYNCFLEGKYSKFSYGAKSLILNYFGNKGEMSKHIESFLDPQPYHEIYSEALNVPLEDIKNVYEVCSVPDINKETFKFKF